MPIVDPSGQVKDSATGCRPDQLFGVWAIEETRFSRMVELALAADLEKLREESKAAAAAEGQAPAYRVTSDGIAVVEISGPMTKYTTSFQSMLGGTSTVKVRQALRAAARDPEVIGIMLVVDSPGGTVGGTSDLADDVRQIAGRKPLYAYVSDCACSGALWAASGARKIYANVSAEVGSIGVYSVVRDTSGIYAKEGVKVHVISSAPPIKGAGTPGSEVLKEQIEEWQRRVKDIADVFTAEALENGRRMTKEKAQSLATGQVWVADKARQLGLIDGVISLDEAMTRLRREAMAEQESAAALAVAAEAEEKLEQEKAARARVEKELADTKAKLEAHERERREKLFAAEASAIGAPAEFAGVLDKIEAVAGAELYGQLQTQLKAYAEQAKAGPLFTERGSDGGAGAGTAQAQLEALAAQAVKEGRAKTKEQALAIVAKEQPALYTQHLQESRRH